jgi:mannose/cellobiose epimerase-like protein (N-acyl-D-glucosamine 2-epimerase family)
VDRGPTKDRDRLAAKAELGRLRARLVRWLARAAYTQWAQHGIDAQEGGFLESLGRDGSDLGQPRRSRVHPRQVYAFAQASRFGWQGDAAGIVRRGIEYFIVYYRREDGLFRTLTDGDGGPLDDRALLYDQAFALFGFAAAAAALDASGEFERQALELRSLIETRFGTGDGAFRSSADQDALRESNPHMHLLEACLAWADIGDDAGWVAWVRDLAGIALARFVRQDSGALGEAFTPSWQPAAGLAGRLIEPGHQFEWAWLLLRSEPYYPGPLRPAALRLIAIAEEAGVRDGVAVNALLDDFTIHDPRSRLWPQTERLKAALLAAQTTGRAEYWSMAQTAAASLLPYLDTPIAGLWFDVRLPGGEMIDSPVPASTFYHLVCAIAALDDALAEAILPPRA